MGSDNTSDSGYPGNYILRAYTNWMKNFAPIFIMNKPFTL